MLRERYRITTAFERMCNAFLSERRMGFYDIKYGDVVKMGDDRLKDDKGKPTNNEKLYAADSAIGEIYEYKQAIRAEKRRVVSPNVSKPDKNTILNALSNIYVYLAQWKNRNEIFVEINDNFDGCAKSIRNTTSLCIEATLADAKRRKESSKGY
jgi:hypothetical protein